MVSEDFAMSREYAIYMFEKAGWAGGAWAGIRAAQKAALGLGGAGGSGGSGGPAIRWVPFGSDGACYELRTLDPWTFMRGVGGVGTDGTGPASVVKVRLPEEDMLRLIDTDGIEEELLNRLHYTERLRDAEIGELSDDDLEAASLTQAGFFLTRPVLAEAKRQWRRRMRPRKGLREAASAWIALKPRQLPQG